MRYRRTYPGFTLGAVAVLIAVNVIFYLATVVDSDLIRQLGLQPASLSERPWTIVTNLFIHGGLWHLLANMVTFYFFGSYVAALVGEGRLLLVYFLGGIMGNAFYILLGDPLVTAIGASGAVFACGGALTAMRPKLRVMVFPIPAPLPLWAAVLGGFVVISFFPNVAWEAHLGGLAFGLAAGYFFISGRRRS